MTIDDLVPGALISCKSPRKVPCLLVSVVFQEPDEYEHDIYIMYVCSDGVEDGIVSTQMLLDDFERYA